MVATEPIIRAESHQTTAAVGTVVVFGTLSMFLYPVVFHSGLVPLSEEVGIYIGATSMASLIVGAAGTISDAVCDNAMITKMTRVMLLAPFLITLSVFTRSRDGQPVEKAEDHHSLVRSRFHRCRRVQLIRLIADRTSNTSTPWTPSCSVCR